MTEAKKRRSKIYIDRAYELTRSQQSKNNAIYINN